MASTGRATAARPGSERWLARPQTSGKRSASAAARLTAIEKVLARGPQQAPLTRDLGGTGSTAALGRAIAAAL